MDVSQRHSAADAVAYIHHNWHVQTFHPNDTDHARTKDSEEIFRVNKEGGGVQQSQKTLEKLEWNEGEHASGEQDWDEDENLDDESWEMSELAQKLGRFDIPESQIQIRGSSEKNSSIANHTVAASFISTSALHVARADSTSVEFGSSQVCGNARREGYGA